MPVNRLARDLHLGGDTDRAGEIYKWALEVSEQALGPEDDHTVFQRSRYAEFLRAIERVEEADEISGS